MAVKLEYVLSTSHEMFDSDRTRIRMDSSLLTNSRNGSRRARCKLIRRCFCLPNLEFLTFVALSSVQLVKQGQDGDLDRLLIKHTESQKEDPPTTTNA